MTKAELLRKYLIDSEEFTEEELSLDDIAESGWETFEVLGREYAIYTDEEADEAAAEYIRESVWAFNPDFVIEHSKVLDYDDASHDIIRIIGEKCEGGNEAMTRLIDDIEEFIEDAIESDGRGNFLNTYDGEENEVEDDNGETFYIYRLN